MHCFAVRRGLRQAAVATALSALAVPAAANASGFLFFGPQLAALPVLLGSGSVCITYTYDQNGNRTLQTAATINSGQTLWGSGTFGCFMWSQ